MVLTWLDHSIILTYFFTFTRIMDLASKKSAGFNRQLGLLGLTATGICSMIGASIFIMPFMIQRNVPGIGPYVLPAFLVAAIPAILAAFAYAVLSSAMPRAGGSYIYVSRGLHPYLGFVASFSQWFGLSIVIGVICYMIIPFFRDLALAAGWNNLAVYFETGWIRLILSLAVLWLFVWINMRGIKLYERTLIPLMILMFSLGTIVIIAGLRFNHSDFESALDAMDGQVISTKSTNFNLFTFLSAAAVLFASFIGFDSIAQAGGEAKNPERLLPRAIALAIIIVTSFYFVFTFAVYHAIPWQYVADEAMKKDISAPGLFSILLSPFWGILILLGATIALINDLPAMLLSVSRLLFAWSEDGIFPAWIAKIDPGSNTPRTALVLSGVLASCGILGSHFAGDFFLGVDIMVMSMLINFLLMCITLVSLPLVNPIITQKIKILLPGSVMSMIAWAGIVLLLGFLVIHLWKDLTSRVSHWYYHSTYVWITVVGLASLIYGYRIRILKRTGSDFKKLFSTLPKE